MPLATACASHKPNSAGDFAVCLHSPPFVPTPSATELAQAFAARPCWAQSQTGVSPERPW